MFLRVSALLTSFVSKQQKMVLPGNSSMRKFQIPRLPACHQVCLVWLLCLVPALVFGGLQPLQGKTALAVEHPALTDEWSEATRQSAGETMTKNIKDFFLFGDFIHKNTIHTVLFNRKGWEMAPPIIRLNSAETLVLRFDDLNADYRNYSFTVVHCNADWTPSGLNPFEYLDGFFEDQVTDYAHSVNTRIPYSHYTLEFPNDNIRPRISGNYLLQVFVDGNRDDLVLTRRFMVYEPLVAIDANAGMANLVRHRDSKQQVSLEINTGGYPVSNPHQDLKVIITQNGRWDNAIKGLSPRSIMGSRLVYDYEERTLFDGGNEFRRFDTRSLRFLTERVAEINSTARHWDVFLLPDQRRQFRRYSSDNDINGRFTIKNQDGRDDMLESDYAWVHFSLPMDAPLATGGIYIMGELTQWHFSGSNQMSYNYPEKKYEISLLLKQGYYNYLYAFVEEGETQADVAFIEGNHSQAENDYSIYVYHRQPGTVYDRLVGITHLNSAVP